MKLPSKKIVPAPLSTSSAPFGLPNIPQNRLEATGWPILCIFPTDPKSSNFSICGHNYEIRIFKHPLWPLAILNTNSNSLKIYESYSVFTIEKGKRGPLVANGLLSQLAIDSLLSLENCRVKIFPTHQFANSIQINPVKSGIGCVREATVQYYPKSIEAYCITSKKKEPYKFSSNVLTLVYFTGSWCPPCKLAHSDIQKFHLRYKSKIKLIAIDKEETTDASVKYYKESHAGWDWYYIPFNCAESTCLDKLFNVNTYPTFILIDKSSRLVATSSASDGMQIMEDLYANYIR
ncbi:MAG: thioredoxin family protein [Chitinophagaceae bacterium]